MKYLLIALLQCFSSLTIGQITNCTQQFLLPEQAIETSGLIFLNGKIITHNDSDGGNFLFELDSLSGEINRTITIENATNVDWEDISIDNEYIYIGDIGNNDGNRTDLGVYRISISDFSSNENVTAEQISFQYADQIDFTSAPEQTAFDAEALTVIGDSIFVFTKNWIDETTVIYGFPKAIGDYNVMPIATIDSQGLITGATYNSITDLILLTGYSTLLSPFIVAISDFTNDDFSNALITKTTLPSPLGYGSQVEAITWISSDRYFISRELFQTTIAGVPLVYESAMFVMNYNQPIPSNVKEVLTSIRLFPNPAIDTLNVEINEELGSRHFVILGADGKEMIKGKMTGRKMSIPISDLSQGIYFFKLGDAVIAFSKH
jgi:hypothetical protein